MSKESRDRAEQIAQALREAIGPEIPPEDQIRIDKVWAEEAERRLTAYREGRITGVPLEEVFRDEKPPRN